MVLNTIKRLAIALSIAISTYAITSQAFALDIKPGKYVHIFNDDTCGAYTVDTAGKFTKYEYGPCRKKPDFVTKRVRVLGKTLKSGEVTIKKIKVDGKCFSGTWYWREWTVPGKRFCRQ